MNRGLQHARRLTEIAEGEVREILAALPGDLRGPAGQLPIVYDARTPGQLRRDGVEDVLGLFVGDNFVESGTSHGGLPPQIILYLENLWLEAGGDESIYRRELRTTLLHELGHYLGLEEIDLEERGL